MPRWVRHSGSKKSISTTPVPTGARRPSRHVTGHRWLSCSSDCSNAEANRPEPTRSRAALRSRFNAGRARCDDLLRPLLNGLGQTVDPQVTGSTPVGHPNSPRERPARAVMSSHARSLNRSKSLHRIAPLPGALAAHDPGRVSQDALDWSGREESAWANPFIGIWIRRLYRGRVPVTTGGTRPPLRLVRSGVDTHDPLRVAYVTPQPPESRHAQPSRQQQPPNNHPTSMGGTCRSTLALERKSKLARSSNRDGEFSLAVRELSRADCFEPVIAQRRNRDGAAVDRGPVVG
jgi:hypothetical protein